MKQMITVHQLNELSENQKERLREWWIPQKGETVFREYDKQVHIVANTHDKPALEDSSCWFVGLANHAGISNKDCLPLLSIGKMIEFLSDISSISRSDDSNEQQWNVRGHDRIYETLQEELCDALWESVKQRL
ncbi:hypothetical protein [Paenibacillus taichungensis]